MVGGDQVLTNGRGLSESGRSNVKIMQRSAWSFVAGCSFTFGLLIASLGGSFNCPTLQETEVTPALSLLQVLKIVIEDGKLLYKKSGTLLDMTKDSTKSKWIFVLSTLKILYVGQKKKGTFQHSSFLAGGATSAAGRLEVQDGILKWSCRY